MTSGRYIFCVIVLIGLLSGPWSEPVLCQEQNEIQQFASDWAKKSNPRLKSKMNLKAIETVFIREEILHIATYEPAGFLIFFYKNNTADIIGFSDEHLYPENPDHPFLTEWLSRIRPDPSTSSLKSTKGISLMQDAMVHPLIRSKWGQGNPWNKFCPVDDDGKTALVGCVAVAMGQVMKKWNWPEKGVGSNSYTPTNFPEYGTVEANFDTTYYNWDAMDFSTPNDASALLLFHLGVATYMNYGPNESGANTSVYATQALMDNFSYYKGMQVREKERFSEKDWFKMLRQELINGRPLIYRGSNPDGGSGHAFNIDGFHSDLYFHINWGWNGAGNGYFRLENMVDGGGNFTKGQAAIFWIQPDNIPMHDRPASAQALPGDGFIQLIWEELVINDFSHYNIYRNEELIGSTWKTQFRDDDVVNGTQYSYHIKASYIGAHPGESVATDDLIVSPWGGMDLPYTLNLEEDPPGWELARASDGFQWGTAADLQVPGNNGRLVSIRSDLADADQQVRDYFISPTLDIRDMEHVAIRFDYVFKQKTGVDYLFLMYRRYDNGLWYPITKLDSTGSWTDWRTVYYYLPDGAKNTQIQIGFYYNDFNGHGYGAAIDNIHIWQIGAPPIPAYTASKTAACEEHPLIFTSNSTGNITNWYWDFGSGAEPRYGYDEGPHTVKYSSPGSKSTTLLLNHLDPLEKNNYLYITAQPEAGFNINTSGLLAEFNDESKNGSYYWWDFGDGHTSTEKSPSNKYHEFEIFKITQVVYNDICEPDTSIIMLDLRINSGLRNREVLSGLSLYPNPVRDELSFKWDQAETMELSVEIFSITGEMLWEKRSFDPLHHKINLQFLPSGIYLIKTFNSFGIKHFRILKE
ncbi:MAG: T9SS type A sorting domain-containing protein [Bacteroidetes bacterium]|jgi:PKD repeat protein|nr:T9SS type A sorting domain-containing protein [Bacteroidota bacterium]MBT4408897.1 T9SS type A sorting domain-containing protein [Bacteroidota bacterium]MBT5425845.1 T9SS type A sorting domain-containing protein [Bacteroidota bacterium]MBT7462440.1 T9SS type A sorting domain-containing protein [Bacteroidota bacterium]